LILLVYSQEKSKKDCPKVNHIAYSAISPPIYVDARKASRFGLADRRSNFLIHYLDPFPPSTLKDKFSKKFKSGGRRKCEHIENSSKGLYDYFTALNIKHKVKHPLFFAIKFNNCVKLYYNNNLASQKLSDQPTLEENLIMRLQNNIYNSKQGNAPKKGIEQQNLQNAEFIMLITETTDMNSFSFAKTISELFEPITNDKMQFVFDPQTLPPGFTELGHTKLEQCYESLHPQLMALQGKQSEVRSENKHDSKHEINREMSKSKFKPVISIKKPETHEIKEKNKNSGTRV